MFYPCSTFTPFRSLFKVNNQRVIQHFTIDLSCLHRSMAKQFLYRCDRYTLRQQLSSESMPGSMPCYTFFDTYDLADILQRPVDIRIAADACQVADVCITLNQI